MQRMTTISGLIEGGREVIRKKVDKISLDLNISQEFLYQARNWGHMGAPYNFLLVKMLQYFPIYSENKEENYKEEQ